jgi:hypothetical protein
MGMTNIILLGLFVVAIVVFHRKFGTAATIGALTGLLLGHCSR